MPGRYYEDYEPGMLLRHEPSRTVTETDNLLFCALSMNPQPLHLDAARALFRYDMHTLPSELSDSIGTSTLFAKRLPSKCEVILPS